LDFKLVLEKLLMNFCKEDVQYALIGGFALGLWGVGRATVDIDFLVKRDDMEKINKIMHSFCYECKYKTENVAQYISPLNLFGEVDFLLAFRELSLKMLKSADEKWVFNNTLKVRVLKPEDIVGLKLQAISNDHSRERIDIADIESILNINKEGINWNLVEKYFKLFKMESLYKKIRRRTLK